MPRNGRGKSPQAAARVTTTTATVTTAAATSATSATAVAAAAAATATADRRPLLLPARRAGGAEVVLLWYGNVGESFPRQPRPVSVCKSRRRPRCPGMDGGRWLVVGG